MKMRKLERSRQIVEAQHQPSFLNGLVIGMVAGAVGYFLLGTKKGKRMRGQLIRQTKKGWKEMEDTITKAEKTGKKLTKKVKKIQTKVKRETKKKQAQVAKEVSRLQVKIDKARKKADKMQDNLKKTASKIERRFFNQNGRSLGK